VNRPHFARLVVYCGGLDGEIKVQWKAIENPRELVDHRANQQERSRQLLADFAEGHGGTNPSEEEKRMP
jgi:hypothetical protein